MTDYDALERLLAYSNDLRHTEPSREDAEIDLLGHVPALLRDARRVSVLEAALRADLIRQERAIAMFRREGFVFEGKGRRWEKLAFTLYTDLVDSAEQARAALEARDE